ncbi:MAG: hypothetical protein AB7E55_04545 [Pigmentiphaga sp.]
MSLATQTAAEAAKAAPPVAVTIAAVADGFTVNHAVAGATLLYIVLQAGYLIWKWRRDMREDRRRNGGGCAQ